MFSSIKLYIYLAAFLATLSAGFYGGYRWEVSVVDDLKLKYEVASTKAISEALAEKQRQDQVSSEIAKKQAMQQQIILRQTQDHLDEIQKYVKTTCISYNVIRLLNSTVLHTDPLSVPIPSGKSPSSCSGITSNTVAKSIIKNYGIADQNASQLDALIEFYNKTKK